MSLNMDDNVFAGILGEEYHTLKLICPIATEMSRLVAVKVNEYVLQTQAFNVVELGGGTGITTLAMLSANQDINITSIDNAKAMQQQAQQNLTDWEQAGHLNFVHQDALAALQAMPSESVDVIASAYTLHNFEQDYRKALLLECYRVLKTGGAFINGDRYALNDLSQHIQDIQTEVKRYFQVMIAENRLDLLEQWIVHLYADESENHIMREAVALQQMTAVGFKSIDVLRCEGVNALVTAVK